MGVEASLVDLVDAGLEAGDHGEDEEEQDVDCAQRLHPSPAQYVCKWKSEFSDMNTIIEPSQSSP